MPPRLLALAVLGLISVEAAASLVHGEQVTKGQIPFRYASRLRTEAAGNDRQRANGEAVRWATPMADG